MLKFFDANKKGSLKKLDLILSSRKLTQQSNTTIVKKIVSTVKRQGDKAVIKFEKKFSKIQNTESKIIFSKKEINQISKKINKKLKKSIDTAFTRIKQFHLKQKFLPFKYRDKLKNELEYKYLPIERV